MTYTVKSIVSDYKLGKIADKLQELHALVEGSADIFDWTGKRLDEVIKMQPSYRAFYGKALNECRTIEAVLKSRLDQVEGDLYIALNETNNRALGQRDMSYYIKRDPKYVDVLDAYIAVCAVKRELEEVHENIVNMSYSLTNITKLRVAAVEEATL